MICPACKASGLTGRVTLASTETTLVYSPMSWDENGVGVSHDQNTRTEQYCCSNGHNWSEVKK